MLLRRHCAAVTRRAGCARACGACPLSSRVLAPAAGGAGASQRDATGRSMQQGCPIRAQVIAQRRLSACVGRGGARAARQRPPPACTARGRRADRAGARRAGNRAAELAVALRGARGAGRPGRRGGAAARARGRRGRRGGRSGRRRRALGPQLGARRAGRAPGAARRAGHAGPGRAAAQLGQARPGDPSGSVLAACLGLSWPRSRPAGPGAAGRPNTPCVPHCSLLVWGCAGMVSDGLS